MRSKYHIVSSLEVAMWMLFIAEMFTVLNKIRMMMPIDSNVDVVYCRDVHNAEQDQNDDA